MCPPQLAAEAVLLCIDGSEPENQRCGSAWAIFRQIGGSTSVEPAAGQCCIDQKAEVYDAELHAIQKGLFLILSLNCHPKEIAVCVDNQSALAALAYENPTGSEFARNTPLIHHLRDKGWSVKGLRTPAHCGIPGNEQRMD